MEVVMDALERLVLLASIDSEICCLDHGPYGEEASAVDYIVVPIGDLQKKVREYDLTIPVCEDCLKSLTDDEWTLLFCLECTSSHWVLNKLAKLDYPKSPVWLCGCPKCKDKAETNIHM